MTDVKLLTDPNEKTIEDRAAAVESPAEFYTWFSRRPDVREILRRLAAWQPDDEERGPEQPAHDE
jgi:hypothetical protein